MSDPGVCLMSVVMTVELLRLVIMQSNYASAYRLTGACKGLHAHRNEIPRAEDWILSLYRDFMRGLNLPLVSVDGEEWLYTQFRKRHGREDVKVLNNLYSFCESLFETFPGQLLCRARIVFKVHWIKLDEDYTSYSEYANIQTITLCDSVNPTIPDFRCFQVDVDPIPKQLAKTIKSVLEWERFYDEIDGTTRFARVVIEEQPIPIQEPNKRIVRVIMPAA